MSIERPSPTPVDCLREVGRLIQRGHGPTCIDAAQKLQAVEKDANDTSTKRPADAGASSLNGNDVMMMHGRLKVVQERVAEVNKDTLETEKSKDEFQNEIEEFDQRQYPKRSHTHDDDGDDHEILCEEVVLLLVQVMLECVRSRAWTEDQFVVTTSSGKEETHMCPGHNWLLKFGKVVGNMSCVERVTTSSG